MTASPGKIKFDASVPPKNSVIEAFKKSSYQPKDPEYGFGTGSRPPLNNPTAGPGPGAYAIKTTLGKLVESNFMSPCEFTLKSRQSFGDPYARAMSKTTANEPGPGQYNLLGKFQGGESPRKSAFPKAKAPRPKGGLAPGPGTYEPLQSIGHQPVSTKVDVPRPVFGKADRPTMVPPGTTDIGPGQYGPFNAACEEQIDSRKRTCSSLKFGTGYKKNANSLKADLSDPAPGPGSYTLPGGVGTVAKGCPFRDAPAASISGRTKFGSPW